MPATDYSSLHSHHSFPSPPAPSPHEADVASFERLIASRFSELLNDQDKPPILSLPWIRDFLSAFISIHEEFGVILMKTRGLVKKPPLDRTVQEFYERSVKALDVCNAIRDGIDQIREWRNILEIPILALDCNKGSGEGQFRRAKKALIDLSISMLDEKDCSVVSHRNRSFGRQNAGGNSRGHFRSLSWSVSRSWSAARQLQAIGSGLVAPRGSELAATGGLAGAVYAMGIVILLVMWVLVAAIPCQDRGLHVHFSVPRGVSWGAAVVGVHDRVMEEARRKERRNACGLLREIHQLERCSRGVGELVDSVVQFPLSEEKEREVRERVAEMRVVYDGLKEGLDPLERQVREVFHRIVISRTEGLGSVGRGVGH